MTKRTPQIENAILDGFANGQRLVDMCDKHGISRTTFQRWRREDPELARRYEDVQADHAEAMIEDCLPIADNPSSAWVGRVSGSTDADHIRHARFRIDVRFKIARAHQKRHDAALARRTREEERQAAKADKAAKTASAREYPGNVALLEPTRERADGDGYPHVRSPADEAYPRRAAAGP